jgi:hypothetical protein
MSNLSPKYVTQLNLPDALPHQEIKKVIEDVYFVVGTNLVVHDGLRIQTSRTMTIIRENNDLTLINSIRLNEASLRDLEKLGKIKNVVRLGAFHGRDDAFYQKVYGAKLFALPQMDFSHGEVLDYDLNQHLPLAHAKILAFKTTKFKEAVLLIKKSMPILIACDSIKNWQSKDQFFSDETYEMMKIAGSIGPAKIDKTWLQAMNPSKEEIKAIGDLDFSILISAHGLPLMNKAKEALLSSIAAVI